MTQRKPVAFLEAVVRIPLFDGDKTEGKWDGFEYREPGITPDGRLGVCIRKAKVLSAKIIKL